MFKPVKKYQKGGKSSVEGYRTYSPDVNNDYNIINSNIIGTDNMAFPIIATDGKTKKILHPNTGDHKFQNGKVLEIPLRFQQGGLNISINNPVGKDTEYDSVPDYLYYAKAVKDGNIEAQNKMLDHVTGIRGIQTATDLKFLSKSLQNSSLNDIAKRGISTANPEMKKLYRTINENPDIMNHFDFIMPEKSPLLAKQKDGGIAIKQMGGYSTINQHPIDTNLDNVIAPNLTGLQSSLSFNPQPTRVPQDRDLSYLPLFTNSIAQALAKKTEFSRQNEYQQSNLTNPLNILPMQNNTNSYEKYGQSIFQKGGSLWNTNKKGFVDSTLNANRNLDWVKRLYESNAPSIQIEGEPDRSTHFMGDDGNGYVFPTVVRENGKLKYLGNSAEDYARNTKTGIQFSKEQGDWFANNGYKLGTNVNNSINSKGIPYNNPNYKFQEGGMTGDYEDIQDEDFLFEQDTPEPEQQAPTEVITTQLPQEEEQPAIQIDDSENNIEVPENSPFTRNDNGLINPLSSSKYANTTPTKGEDKAYDYLVNTKGLQPHIASGIVGNLIEESGLNTSAIGDSGLARGIAQWHPDRQKGLNSFAATQGKNPSDFYTQLDYVVEEAKQRGDLSKVAQAKSPAEAANLFAKHYERPKIVSNSRLANAERIFKKFNK